MEIYVQKTTPKNAWKMEIRNSQKQRQKNDSQFRI